MRNSSLSRLYPPWMTSEWIFQGRTVSAADLAGIRAWRAEHLSWHQTQQNLQTAIASGRARWKIENENHQTLKVALDKATHDN